jgi:hypothetical protein
VRWDGPFPGAERPRRPRSQRHGQALRVVATASANPTGSMLPASGPEGTPAVLVMTHVEKTTAFTTAPTTAMGRLGNADASSPQPICPIAKATNVRP